MVEVERGRREMQHQSPGCAGEAALPSVTLWLADVRVSVSAPPLWTRILTVGGPNSRIVASPTALKEPKTTIPAFGEPVRSAPVSMEKDLPAGMTRFASR